MKQRHTIMEEALKELEQVLHIPKWMKVLLEQGIPKPKGPCQLDCAYKSLNMVLLNLKKSVSPLYQDLELKGLLFLTLPRLTRLLWLSSASS